MADEKITIEELGLDEYKYGFTSKIDMEIAPKGLNEEIIEMISEKKNEPKFMLDFRIKAFRAWQKMEEPKWANIFRLESPKTS